MMGVPPNQMMMMAQQGMMQQGMMPMQQRGMVSLASDLRQP